MDRLRDLWEYLIGRAEEFPLENRLYHSFCILIIVAVTYNIIFNFSIGLLVSGFITLFLLVAQSFLFYLARFKQKLAVSQLISGILLNVLFALNYYFNSGIKGPTLLLGILVFYLIIAVSPSRLYFLWMLLNVSLVFIIVGHEYVSPELIVKNYPSKFSHFADIVATYIVVIIVLFTGTAYLRKNYNAERKLALERNIQLEHLNKEKTKMFSIVAHDLSAPITSLLQYLELFSGTPLESADKKYIEGKLIQATRNTHALLSNILFWARSQMENMQVNLMELNLSETLTNTLELQQLLAQQKNIKLNYSIPANIQVKADRDMLQLIVRNLVSNAIKFTPQQGQIFISAEVKNENCVLMVQDTGRGISPNIQAQIFSFKSTSTYGTNHEKGVGLGLVLCKEFVEAQHGEIWFESEPGKGTFFYFSVPLAIS